MARPTRELPDWIDQPAPKPAPRSMQVAVTTDVQRRFTYEGLFASTFDAYDDAMERFPHAARIEVKANPANGGRHGA